MWIKTLTMLAAGSVAAKLMKDYWDGARRQQQRSRSPVHSEAEQRWEDEGGLVPAVMAQHPDAPAR
jgi:hypothetical protein